MTSKPLSPYLTNRYHASVLHLTRFESHHGKLTSQKGDFWVSRSILHSKACCVTWMASPFTKASHSTFLIQASVKTHICFLGLPPKTWTSWTEANTASESSSNSRLCQSPKEKWILVKANAGSRHMRTNAVTAKWATELIYKGSRGVSVAGGWCAPPEVLVHTLI